MKKLLNIMMLFALGGALMSCSGNSGDDPAASDGVLRLSADKTTISANGVDRVTFSVTYGNQDVSKSGATLYLIEKNGEAVSERQSSWLFGSREEGTYVFEARYYTGGQNLKSESQITVTVTAAEKVEEVFYRKIFGQYFTSIGCHNCPQMNAVLKGLDQQYKERLVVATFHTDFSGIQDPMTVAVTMDYMINVLFQNGLPAFYLDLNPNTSCYGTTTEKTTIANIENTLAKYPATCGIKIESSYDAATRRLSANVTVKASVTNEYRILAFLVEDGIVYPQEGASADYVHDNVVRAALSTQLIGDRLNTIEKDAEASKPYSMTLSEDWNADNMRLVVCVLDTTNGADFVGSNAATGGINEPIDYAYNE